MLSFLKKALGGGWFQSSGSYTEETVSSTTTATGSKIQSNSGQNPQALIKEDGMNLLYKTECFSKLLDFVRPFGLQNVPVIPTDRVRCGGTGYLDLMEPDLFASCPTGAKLIRGQDEYGRHFLSMYLKIEKCFANTAKTDHDPQESGVHSFTAVYTVFQRYMNDSDKICICNSHSAKDTSQVLIGSLLEMGGGLDLGNCPAALSRFQEMLESLLKHQVWQRAVPSWENCSEKEVDEFLNGTTVDAYQSEHRVTVYRVYFA